MEKFHYRTNRAIRVPEVFLIDETGQVIGKTKTYEALSLAEERGLDLVEVNPNANPPICKIIDFGKFTYELEKKAQKNKSGKVGEIKEIQFGIKTDEHDFQTKIEHAKRFIEKGYKVKVTVKMMGRENIYSDKALEQLERIKSSLNVEFEQNPVKMGNRVSVIMTKRKGR